MFTKTAPAALLPAATRSAFTTTPIALSLAMLLSSLGISIVNVALPTLATTFSASVEQVQWVVVAYLLANTALIVVAGHLGDLAGRGRLLMTGLALFTAASAAGSASPTLAWLITARVVQGIGAAAMAALAMALAGAMVSKDMQGRAMGWLGTMSAVGTALGPSLGGVLIAAYGWRAIFVAQVVLGSGALFVAWQTLPADGPVGNAPRVQGPHVSRFAVWSTGMAAALGANTLVSTVMMATLIVGPFYLSRALGLGAATVGALMSLGPLVAAFTAAPAGRFVDRVGTSRASRLGIAGLAAGAAGLALLPARAGVAGYVFPILVITASYALFQTGNNTAVMARSDADRRGVVSALLSLSRNVGLIMGASAMGSVFARATGTGNIAIASADEVAFGMRVVFVVATALILVAAALSRAASRPPATENSPGLFLRRMRKQSRSCFPSARPSGTLIADAVRTSGKSIRE